MRIRKKRRTTRRRTGSVTFSDALIISVLIHFFEFVTFAELFVYINKNYKYPFQFVISAWCKQNYTRIFRKAIVGQFR